ncbi:hypothetical protein C9374_005949 [Naegleria lovaniensis]|uniref:Uncharacterized protein n=1 Tax=Naegleria lovaniensis TaxID=51637 RepID=A0AA88GK13_NAELO|nr:uncharacterized protein C9374_005949 [Naegleria lovaniensis]KAG2381565.1 hypothetical protein C9374_005949 [Naegleria lovaniensis]
MNSESMTEDLNTNLNVLQQASSILDEELEELGDGPFGKLSLEQLAKTSDPSLFLMMDGLNSGFSSFVPTPREVVNSTSETEEEAQQLERGQLFDKTIPLKEENETNFHPLLLQDTELFTRYVTPSGNVIERIGSESIQINHNKIIQFPNNSFGNNNELNNTNIEHNSQELTEYKVTMKSPQDESSMIVDEASLIPTFTERKSVAHNIRLLAASKLLNEIPDEEEECSDEWLVSPRSKPIEHSTASLNTTSVPITAINLKQPQTATQQHGSHHQIKTTLTMHDQDMKKNETNNNIKSNQHHHDNVSTESFSSSSSEISSSISEDENDEEFHVDDTLSDKGLSTRKTNDAKASKYKTISSLPSTSSGSLASKLQNSNNTTPKNTLATTRKTQQKASDSASSSKSFREATGYKPQFFNPPDEVKCKEPSEQKKQQWDKKKSTHVTNSSHASSAKKPSVRDIPNSTIYPPPQPHTSPKRPSMNRSLIEPPSKSATTEKTTLSSHASNGTTQQKKLALNTSSHAGNNQHAEVATSSKKESNIPKPSSRATTPTFSYVSQSVELNHMYEEPLEALEASHYGVDTNSENSFDESHDEFELDELTACSVSDVVNSKSWKLMRWRRDNLREKNFSSSLKKLTANRNSQQQEELSKIPQQLLQKDQNYESCVIARDITNEIIDCTVQKVTAQKSQFIHLPEVTVSLFGSIVLSKTVEEMLTHALLSSPSSHQHVAKVSISIFSSVSGKIPDYVENNIPCFIELFKPANLNNIKAYYSTFVNIPNNISSLVGRNTNQLIGTFYYDIDLLAQEVKINLTNKSCYQWKDASTIYFPFEKSEKFEGDSSSLNASLMTFFKLKRGDTKTDSSEIPYILNAKKNISKVAQSKRSVGESNIYAVNLNSSESMIESPLPVNKSLYNTTLHSEDIQLSPVFMPTSPVQPHHQIGQRKAGATSNAGERNPKCCFM